MKKALSLLLAVLLIISMIPTSIAMASTVTVWSGEADTTWEGEGTKNSPFILSTAEEVYGMVTSGGNGSYYKIADGVTDLYFNAVNGMSKAQATAFFTGADAKKSWYTGDTAFSGTFDGNGATLYGLYSVDDAGYNAFINYVVHGGAATVKNVNFDLCYFANTAASANPWNHGSGVVFGRINKTTSAPTDGSTKAAATIEKVKITNSTTTSHNGAAILFGTAVNASINLNKVITVNNDYTSDNASSNAANAAALVVGGSGWSCAGGALSNVIFTETGVIIPVSQNISNFFAESTSAYIAGTIRANNEAYMTKITQDQMKGAAAQTNMPNLVWAPGGFQVGAEGEYPTFAPELNFGYDVWNGTAAAGFASGSGSATDPYIIETAEQLYKMVQSGGNNGSYYKVADGIDVLYANPVKDVADTKAYFENEESMKFAWAPTATTFNGTFDGNGVKLVGLYNVASGNANSAFIPQMLGGTATIKNVQFDNCYFKAAGNNAWRFGTAAVIVGGSNTSAPTTKINIENVVITNSFVMSVGTGTVEEPNGNNALFVAGMSNGYTLNVNNVLAYGNNLATTKYQGGNAIIVGDSYSTSADYPITINISNAVLADDVPFVQKSVRSGTGTQTNGSCITVNTYENIYAVNVPDNGKTFDGVTELTADKMVGADAPVNMPDLNWSDWATTNSYPEIVALHDLVFTSKGDDSGHSVSCNDCDITVELAPHKYDENYVCTLCGFVHTHSMVDSATGAPVDCTTNGEVATKCEKGCGYTSTRVVEATGHEFGEVQEATDGDCCNSGTVEYKECEVCEGKFAPDADKMSTDVLETIETGVMGEHDWVPQDAIKSECSNKENVDYSKCLICEKYLIGDEIVETAPSAPQHSAIASEYDETNHWDVCECGEKFNISAHVGNPCECGHYVILGYWRQDANGWWYENIDGGYKANEWLNDNGTWYYFNSNGYMVTSWQSIGGTWYYFGGSGAMATGWAFDGAWYYFDASGAMVTGWKNIDGTWYFFEDSGAMDENPESDSPVYSLTDDSVLSQLKFNGRPYITDKGVALDFPASTIEFKSNCSGDVYLEYNYNDKGTTGKRYFIVYVDGVMVKDRTAINDDGYLYLAKDLPEGEHTFKLLNDTDVGNGPLVTFTKLAVNGSLIADTSDKPIIEFLGDSLSSGVGTLCLNGTDGQHGADYQSAVTANPYLIAQELGYDYRIVSRGGIGLKAGTTTPDFVDFYRSANWWRGDKSEFTAQSPSDVDVLVVNLGTNDVGTYKTFDTTNADHIAKYSQYYADLIINIGYSTDTKIIFVAGVGGCTGQNKAFAGAIEILNAAGYNDVYSFTAGRYMSGGAMHPTAQQQAIVAGEILAAMKEYGMV